MPITPKEREVIDLLAEAWNAYLELPVEHPTHRQEFMFAIHQAQQLVLSRPTSRDLGFAITETEEKP
jgi:hypothetical protein